MTGRKPKPVELKRLAGNPGKRPLPNPPQFPPADLRPPRGMSREARREWTRIALTLARLGLLTEADRWALEALCETYARWRRAERKVREQGEVLLSDRGGQYYNYWLSVANKALEQMMRLATEFGLTPSARTRLSARDAGQEVSLAELLFGEEVVVEDVGAGRESGEGGDQLL